MEFKEILLEYLQVKGMTQTEFAKKIGVKQSQISEWLKGKAKPSYDLMKQILKESNENAIFWFDLDNK